MENKSKIKNRITIAIDDATAKIINLLKEDSNCSQSELIRKAIKFYHKFNIIIKNQKNGSADRIYTYLELLTHGEHIILDIDHYLSFLKFVEESSDQKRFWEINRAIGKAHAEEFRQTLKVSTLENVLERLEVCNFFKIVKDTSNGYTLLLGSDIQKNFIKIFLEEVLNGMGFNVLIQEGLSKIKIIKSQKNP